MSLPREVIAAARADSGFLFDACWEALRAPRHECDTLSSAIFVNMESSDQRLPTISDVAANVEVPATPTATSERVEVLDVLRGLALYGVLLANAVWGYSGGMFAPRPAPPVQRDTIDQAFLLLLEALCSGKAMYLLTTLFGLGFALQLRRADSGGRSVVPLHLRRMAALAFLGLSHVLLLWWGDILWGYAVAGVWLVLFRRVRGTKLLLWGFGLALLPQFVASLPPIHKWLAPIQTRTVDLVAFRAEVWAAINSHDRRMLPFVHAKQAYLFVGHFWVAYFPGLLGRFLIGYWAGSTMIFSQITERLPFFRRLAAWGLSLGIAASGFVSAVHFYARSSPVLSEAFMCAISLVYELSVLLLGCGYGAAVVLLVQRATFHRVLRLIAPVGQMALTTYIGQSLICTLLFYGWGFGLAPRVQAARVFSITLGVFLLQVLLAHAWLSFFRFGPMEWLWRSLTYGRLQPMRRD